MTSTWPQNAYVGQKVVRFRDNIHPLDSLTVHPCPPINEIVTVSWIGYTNLFDVPLIDLEEYPSPETAIYLRGWDARIFRPAQSTEKGMEILKEILVTQKVKEDV